jgi:alpha-beta hydrolase superfamily lysophospholipase
LCPALGYEYMSSYRALRQLAYRLAGLGFDVLRIDYDGTGNSAGGAADPGRVAAWILSISRAIVEARRLAGTQHVALVGVRAGALLALQAAASGGVARLVLWSPFQSGRAFVRELTALSRLSHEDDAGEEQHDGEGVNVEGHYFTAETLAALGRWTPGDLTARPAQDVLVLDREDRPTGPVLEDKLTALGCNVVMRTIGGTAAMLLPPHLSQVPTTALDDIAAWMSEWKPAARPAPPATTISTTATASRVARNHRDAERTVRFGPRDRLFGIVSCRDESSKKPAIILFNTGAGHHVGPHRLYVPLARDWADRGHLVLRFDLGGIGESAPPPGGGEGVVYPEHMVQDASEAIAFVRKEAPHRPVIVAGLCSGGWLAFQAARHGLAVDGVAAINAPLYLYEADMRWLSEGRALARYQQSMRDPAKWAKALRGQASFSTFTRVAASALSRLVSTRVSGTLSREPAHPFTRDLNAVAARGVRCLFVFSREDHALPYFRLHAHDALRRSEVRELVNCITVDDAGHTFRRRESQAALTAILGTFVSAPQQAPAALAPLDTLKVHCL